jgi:hypothetical protein
VQICQVIIVFMKRKLKPHTAQRLSRVERLRFLVQFAQVNLTMMRPGDWLNLKDDLQRVLTGAVYGPDFDFGTDAPPVPDGFMAHPVGPPWPETFSKADFARLQAETRVILTEMVLGARETHAPVVAPVPYQVAVKITCVDGQYVLIAEGPLRDVVLWLLFQVLLEGAALLVRCPECGTLFLPHRNQEYCGRACTNRVAQRLWRDRRDTATTAS